MPDIGIAPPKPWRPSRDWHAILPPEVATRQIRWERIRDAKRMRSAGLTFAAIGNRLGVSVSRATQIATQTELQRLAPAQKWMKERIRDDIEIAVLNELKGPLRVPDALLCPRRTHVVERVVEKVVERPVNRIVERYPAWHRAFLTDPPLYQAVWVATKPPSGAGVTYWFAMKTKHGWVGAADHQPLPTVWYWMPLPPPPDMTDDHD